jgi:hypothetical protein
VNGGWLTLPLRADPEVCGDSNEAHAYPSDIFGSSKLTLVLPASVAR